MNRLRIAWRLIHHGTVDSGPVPDDIDEARRQRRSAERGLEEARAQRPEVDEAARRLSASQRDLDFTALVEEAFTRRPRPRPSQ